MGAQFKPGDEFVFQGKKWICLEPKQTRMVAMEMDTFRMASFAMVDSIEKTGVSWNKLITAIEEAHANLKPEDTIVLESQEFTVKEVIPKGDIKAVSKYGTSYRIRKWSLWWENLVPPECLPSEEDHAVVDTKQAIIIEIENLRSHKWRDEAYYQLKKHGHEAVPYLLLGMGVSLDRIENAPVKFIGGEGKLNLGPCKVPSSVDQHVLKLCSQIIADISVDGHLKSVLEVIEYINEEIRNRVITDLLHLKRCKAYTKECLEESIAGSPFSADVVFQILAKMRGKDALEMLEKEAKHGLNKETREAALRYLKSIASNQAREIIARIESKSVSKKQSSRVETLLHNFHNRKTKYGRENALVKLGNFGDSPEAVVEIFRQVDKPHYSYSAREALEKLQQHPDAPVTLLSCFIDGKIQNRAAASEFLGRTFEIIKRRLEEIWPNVSYDTEIYYLILESYTHAKDKGLLADAVRCLQDESSSEKALCTCLEYLQQVGSSDESLAIQHLLDSSTQAVRHSAWQTFSIIDSDKFLVWTKKKLKNIWDNGHLEDQLEIGIDVLTAASVQLERTATNLPLAVKVFGFLLQLGQKNLAYNKHGVFKTFFCKVSQVHSRGEDVAKPVVELFIHIAQNREWNLFNDLMRQFPEPWSCIATSNNLLRVLEKNIESFDRNTLGNAMRCLINTNRDNAIRKMFREHLPPAWPEEGIKNRDAFSDYKKEILRSLSKLEEIVPVLIEHVDTKWTEEWCLLLDEEIQSAVNAAKEGRFGLFLVARDQVGINRVGKIPIVVIKVMKALSKEGKSGHLLLKDMKKRLEEVAPPTPFELLKEASVTLDSLMDIEASVNQSFAHSAWIEEFDEIIGK
ncbi:MAG: hypothetical protein ABIH23_31955 [bacterium]